MAFAISVGKLFRVPPSIRTIPSVRTGSKSPGMDMVERRAVLMDPLPQFFALQLIISEATHTKGIGRSLKDMSS